MRYHHGRENGPKNHILAVTIRIPEWKEIKSHGTSLVWMLRNLLFLKYWFLLLTIWLILLEESGTDRKDAETEWTDKMKNMNRNDDSSFHRFHDVSLNWICFLLWCFKVVSNSKTKWIFVSYGNKAAICKCFRKTQHCISICTKNLYK